MVAVNIYEAKTQLSKLIARVEAGEEVIIARDGTPVVRLVALTTRQFGEDEGVFEVPDDFDDPMPYEWLVQFYGGPPPGGRAAYDRDVRRSRDGRAAKAAPSGEAARLRKATKGRASKGAPTRARRSK